MHIKLFGRTDFKHPIIFNYFVSELLYRDGPFIKNVSFVETQKNVLYSELVNNPFKRESSPTWRTYSVSDASYHVLFGSTDAQPQTH